MISPEDAPLFVGRMVRINCRTGNKGGGQHYNVGKFIGIGPSGTAIVRPGGGHGKDERLDLKYINPWARDLPPNWKKQADPDTGDNGTEPAMKPVVVPAPDTARVPDPLAERDSHPTVSQRETPEEDPEQSLFEAMLPDDIADIKEIGDVADLVRWTLLEINKLEPRRQWLIAMQDAAKQKIQTLYGELAEVLRISRPGPIQPVARNYGGHLIAAAVSRVTKPSEIYSMAQLVNKIAELPDYTGSKEEGALRQALLGYFRNNTDSWEQKARGVYRRKS